MGRGGSRDRQGRKRMISMYIVLFVLYYFLLRGFDCVEGMNYASLFFVVAVAVVVVCYLLVY